MQSLDINISATLHYTKHLEKTKPTASIDRASTYNYYILHTAVISRTRFINDARTLLKNSASQ